MHLGPAVLIGNSTLGVFMQKQLRQLRTSLMEYGVVKGRQSLSIYQIGRAAQVEQRLEGGQIGALDGGVQRSSPVSGPKIEQGATIDQGHQNRTGHRRRSGGDGGGQREGRLPRGNYMMVIFGVFARGGGRRRLVDKVGITAGQRFHHLLQVASGDGGKQAAALSLLACGARYFLGKKL